MLIIKIKIGIYKSLYQFKLEILLLWLLKLYLFVMQLVAMN